METNSGRYMIIVSKQCRSIDVYSFILPPSLNEEFTFLKFISVGKFDCSN